MDLASVGTGIILSRQRAQAYLRRRGSHIAEADFLTTRLKQS